MQENKICLLVMLKIEKTTISFINKYGPTESADSQEKGNFYDIINKICEKIPKNEILHITRICTCINMKRTVQKL